MSAFTLLGGLAYLGQLIASTPTSVNVEYYASIVAETAAKRRIIDAGNRIAELGFEDSSDVEDIMRQSVEVLFGVRPTGEERGFRAAELRAGRLPARRHR